MMLNCLWGISLVKRLLKYFVQFLVGWFSSYWMWKVQLANNYLWYIISQSSFLFSFFRASSSWIQHLISEDLLWFFVVVLLSFLLFLLFPQIPFFCFSFLFFILEAFFKCLVILSCLYLVVRHWMDSILWMAMVCQLVGFMEGS